MVQVKFYPENISVNVEEGTTILQAARIAEITIEAPCNAAGTCGKCKVKLQKDSIKNVISHGKHHLTEEELEDGIVLACASKIIGDISVELIDKEQNDTLKILSHGQSFDYDINTYIKKVYKSNLDITLIYDADEKILGQENKNTENIKYGVVVDIGTTTIVTSLIDLISGKEITSASALNPQAVYAQDVLSRIKFAAEKQGLKIMYEGIINEINNMIENITKNLNIHRENIYEIVLSGNTCMLHLAVNFNPSSLGKYPYTSQIYGGNYLKASDYNVEISPFGKLYLPPIISSYVGADITSGILASQLYKDRGNTLFVDIGTNGEMALSLKGELAAVSTAAGPAFEGMNITCGMRAAKGAVEFFNIDSQGEITIKTIDNEEAIGICGSGLLDIVGELVDKGIINKNGRFINPEKDELNSPLKERLIRQQGKLIFKITDKVYLTQKDIRQVQLAKGAIRAGIEFLLQSKKITASEIDKVLIAGSFGYHLRAKSLINIGLLPKEFQDKIDFVGNTSKSGGQIFLLNRFYKEKMEQLVKNIEVIELANHKDFDKVFIGFLGF